MLSGMCTYKILVQRQEDDGEWTTVSAHEARDADSAEDAVERFIKGWRDRPDPDYPIG
jgi:hypothetical protein